MHHIFSRPTPWVAALLFLSLSAMTVASPVTRDEAYQAATVELPGFYPGNWTPAGEVPLYDLSGAVVAFAFTFDQSQKLAATSSSNTPAVFVERARANLASKGTAVTGYEAELRGEDRYATIVISADDTEPPVLRCFRGLPPQVVREAEALSLAAKGGAGSWRVRHCLMLGFFDEAFVVEPATGTAEALVVDLRMRTVATETATKTRAMTRQAAAPDPDRIRMSQQAWATHQAKTTPGAAPQSKRSASGNNPQKVEATPLDQPSRPLRKEAVQ